MATAETRSKKLFMVFRLDTGKNLTVSLDMPKDDLTSANVAPVMQSCVDKNIFLVGTARVTAAIDAYIRDTTKLDLNTEGV